MTTIQIMLIVLGGLVLAAVASRILFNHSAAFRSFWSLWIPFLDFRLHIPFLEIDTALMYHCWDRQTFQYTTLHLRVFRKWSIDIDLYDTKKRIIVRKCSKP